VRCASGGVGQARIETAHSVHGVLRGRRPGRENFYQFRHGVRQLLAVRAWLLHRVRAAGPGLRDLVLHLGDYICEYTKDGYVIGGGNPRGNQGPETASLAGYRQRHAQYKSDAELQAAHPQSHRGGWRGMTSQG
jgi:alkaline phosphatase D